MTTYDTEEWLDLFHISTAIQYLAMVAKVLSIEIIHNRPVAAGLRDELAAAGFHASNAAITVDKHLKKMGCDGLFPKSSETK